MILRLLSLLLAATAHAGMAHAQSDSLGRAADRSLQFELFLADTPIMQHEPLAVWVRLTNTSNDIVELDPRFSQEYMDLQFHIVNPYGQSFVHRWIAHADSTACWRPLAPGASMVHRQWLLFGVRRDEYFEFPGEYRVHATFTPPIKGRAPLVLRSEPLAFQVQRVSPIEVQPWHHYRGAARIALGGAGKPNDWISASQTLDAVAHRYPESRYAPWCLFFLARGWQVRQSSYQERAAQEAAAAFDKLIAGYPDFPMIVESRYYLAKERYRLEPAAVHLQQLVALFEKHPSLQLLQKAKEQIDTYENLKHDAPLPTTSLP